MELPERKLTRLPSYDYSSNGCYFVTICTYNRTDLFGYLESGRILMNEYGKITEDELIGLNNHSSNTAVDKYVIMPSHIHCIVSLNNSSSMEWLCLTERSRPFPTKFDNIPSLSTIIGLYKSGVSRRIHLLDSNLKVWQKSFYDHIIRDENEYLAVWKYIDENPLQWREDEYYIF